MAKRLRSYDELATEIVLHSGKDEGSRALLPRPMEMKITYVDGVPTLVGVPLHLSPDPVKGLRELLKVSLDVPYTGPDPSLQGKSNGEAIVLNLIRQAANGDPGARSEVLDRFLGQPAQNINTTTVTGDLTNILTQVAEDMRRQNGEQDSPHAPAPVMTIIDAEPSQDESRSPQDEADDL